MYSAVRMRGDNRSHQGAVCWEYQNERTSHSERRREIGTNREKRFRTSPERISSVLGKTWVSLTSRKLSKSFHLTAEVPIATARTETYRTTTAGSARESNTDTCDAEIATKLCAHLKSLLREVDQRKV